MNRITWPWFKSHSSKLTSFFGTFGTSLYTLFRESASLPMPLELGGTIRFGMGGGPAGAGMDGKSASVIPHSSPYHALVCSSQSRIVKRSPKTTHSPPTRKSRQW